MRLFYLLGVNFDHYFGEFDIYYCYTISYKLMVYRMLSSGTEDVSIFINLSDSISVTSVTIGIILFLKSKIITAFIYKILMHIKCILFIQIL